MNFPGKPLKQTLSDAMLISDAVKKNRLNLSGNKINQKMKNVNLVDNVNLKDNDHQGIIEDSENDDEGKFSDGQIILPNFIHSSSWTNNQNKHSILGEEDDFEVIGKIINDIEKEMNEMINYNFIIFNDKKITCDVRYFSLYYILLIQIDDNLITLALATPMYNGFQCIYNFSCWIFIYLNVGLKW